MMMDPFPPEKILASFIVIPYISISPKALMEMLTSLLTIPLAIPTPTLKSDLNSGGRRAWYKCLW